jgi:hypothetical protein
LTNHKAQLTCDASKLQCLLLLCTWCFCFLQVQQQLQLLGNMLLRDPRMQLAKAKQQQHRRQSSSAAANQQQQTLAKLQQRLPLAAVCIKALQGCYCSLDELRVEFNAAAEKIRWGYLHLVPAQQ